MNSIHLHTPILITGVPRSGSSFIARILKISGGFSGDINKMFENKELNEINSEILVEAEKPVLLPESMKLKTFTDFEGIISTELRKQHIGYLKWFYKNSDLTLLWKIWHKAYPKAKWIMVKRKPTYIIKSCIQTGFMREMKNPKNLKKIGVKTETEGWQWLIREYEKRWVEMYEAGLDIKEVWPDRMETGDFSQINEMLDWVGLNWKPKIVDTINPLINKNRRK